MARPDPTHSDPIVGGDELLTLPSLSRTYKIGLHTLRRAAASGAFPVYMCGSNWPRVRRSEFEVWLKSTCLTFFGANEHRPSKEKT
jgi:hypothetical protein